MKKAAAAFMFISATAAYAKVDLPYFQSMDEQDVCGSTQCQPHSSRRYTFFKNPVDYTGDPATFLGRKYRTVFESSPCMPRPTSTQIVKSGQARFTGVAANNQANRLRGEVKADLAKAVNKVVQVLPASVRADANAEIEKAVTTDSVRKLALEYERIDLNQQFMDDNLDACQKRMSNTEMVTTGIATVRVSGEWTKSRLYDLLQNLESRASFVDVVSGDLRRSYEAGKSELLAGSFEPTAFVIANAWRRKE